MHGVLGIAAFILIKEFRVVGTSLGATDAGVGGA